MTHVRPPVPRRARARGMTLIEVLAAILLMTVGMLGLMSLMARASQVAMSTDDSQRAALLANDLANQMLLANTISLPTATVDAWKTQVSDQTGLGLPSGVGTVTVTGTTARILVVWTPPNTTGQRRYFTDVQL